MPTRTTEPADTAADRIAGECLAVRVRLLNRTITAIYDDALRPLGLTAGQLNILVLITKRGPVSPGDVARRLNMEKSTVSRNIERMRKNGWLTVTLAESGRGQQLLLSKKGKTLLARSVPAWEEAQTSARAVLGRRGADSIHRVGNAVWSSIGQS
jgi:DNA-binding MarR family transcriptional regulator